jgi:hypothetical protein
VSSFTCPILKQKVLKIGKLFLWPFVFGSNQSNPNMRDILFNLFLPSALGSGDDPGVSDIYPTDCLTYILLDTQKALEDVRSELGPISGLIIDHQQSWWYDEAPSKGAKNTAIPIDCNLISRT